MRPFGCPITILNTIDHLGKFDGKADEGFFVGYSINSKAFRVFNSRTRIVEENLHVQFSENTPNIAGSRPNWLFDIDALTKSMNYKPVVAGNQSNGNAGTKACNDADDEKKVTEEPRKEGGNPSNDQEKEDNVNRTNTVNVASTNEVNVVGAKTIIELPDDLNMPKLEDIVYSDDDEDFGAEADMNNLDVFMPVSPIPTTIVHKDHPVEQIIGDLNSAPMHVSPIPTTRVQEVWTLVDLPNGKRAIGTKWVFRNKKNERGIVIKNKARLVAQGYTQEEGIDYDEVFSPVARIEAIRLFLAYASFKDFVVYQMDVKSAFLYGKIEEEVYVCQPQGFEDPDFPDKKSLCTEFEKMMHKKFQMSSMGKLTFFLGLQVKQNEDGIFISQDKYVIEILKKFSFTDVKTVSTPMETQKLLLKDEDGEEVDVHLYRSMIGSLMYLTSSRPDIMFAVCAYARYQVNPKVSHLHAVKRIFRYLKGQPKLGLWYPKDSSFDLVSYTENDYAGASLDRKSTTGGMDFLPNATIFEELTRMGYEKLSQKLTFYKVFFSPQWKFLIHTILQCLSAKTTAWNKFSSTIASAVICLATNQKFNFSKYIFESMVKNLDNAGKFLMYPRFVQVFLEKQLEGMSNHKRTYVTPSYTKKIFGNMRRVGKGFSGRATPLFPTMMVQAQQEQGEDNVADEAINKEMDDSLVRAATTASSLEAKQDNGNIDKTRSKATFNEPNPYGTGSGSGPRRQDTMEDTIAQARFENMSKTYNDSVLAGVNTPQSDEDRLKLNELIEFYTKLQQRFLDLENTKTAQAQEITSLKLRVKKLEKKGGSRTHKLKRLYKRRKIDDIDKDAEITLVHETQGRYGDEEMFDTGVLDGDEVLAEPEVIIKDVNLSVDEVKAQDKGKGIIVEEPVKMKKKDQISLDEELAFKLQAEEEEEERLAREKLKEKKKPTLLHGIIEVRAEGSEIRVEGSSKRAGEELE
ncbi:retrovirus-related pol polyprotein from transposon TNT 1-94 [Tanacetum coccineum]